ncbi:chitinase-3-like protein 2 [Haliotis cracherodii]|uniref:chitinase-3-like protein 2 n=1 Tax=Haliotis cracherodii TaxID=6455 RepID=UPI0039E8BD5D
MLVQGLLFCLAYSLLWGWVTSASSFKRVCYFTNWSGDLMVPAANFYLEDIDARLCSHLIYAFVGINTESLDLLPSSFDVGENGTVGHYVLFNNLKKDHPGLVTLLSVGGETHGDTGFGKVVETMERMQKFANNCVAFLRLWGFDGLDVDWEYPGDPPETKTNFTMLLLELRTAFEKEAEETGRKMLLLSMAAPVDVDVINAGYEVQRISSLVDVINIMAYNFQHIWHHVLGFTAPLYSRKGDDLNVERAVDTWIERGAQREKIVVGIAAYGASFNIAKETSVGAYASGPGDPGPYRKIQGKVAFYEVCEMLEKGEARYVWDDLRKVPYAYTNETWVGYDDEKSVAIKTEWMIQKNMGGVMLWCLDFDDFKGTFCKKGRYPLLRSIVKTVARYFDDITVSTPRTTTAAPPTTTSTSTTTTTTPTPATTTTATTTPTTSPTQTTTVAKTMPSNTTITHATTKRSRPPVTTTTSTRGNDVLTTTQRPHTFTDRWDVNDPGVNNNHGDPGVNNNHGDPGVNNNHGDPGVNNNHGDPGVNNNHGDPGVNNNHDDSGESDNIVNDHVGKGEEGDTGGNAIGDVVVENEAASGDVAAKKTMAITAGSGSISDCIWYRFAFFITVFFKIVW